MHSLGQGKKGDAVVNRSRFSLNVAAVLMLPAITFGATFQIGDVFASVGQGQVKVFSPNGTLIQTLDTGTGSTNTAGGAFDAAGNFYVTSFQTGAITRFDNDGMLIGNILTAVNTVESISFNQAGNMYVGRADGDADVRYLSPSGFLIDQFDVATGPRGSDWVDLAADQQTLFYTSEGSVIRRYDVVADMQQADFATIPGAQLFALRILRDAGVLVAGWNSGNVYRLDANGSLVDTFNFPGTTLFALNLDPDGRTFWTADFNTGEIYRAQISDGAIVNQFNAAPFTQLGGLAVFGEIREGVPPTGVIPEPSTWLLTAAGFALLVYRTRKSQKRRI